MEMVCHTKVATYWVMGRMVQNWDGSMVLIVWHCRGVCSNFSFVECFDSTLLFSQVLGKAVYS